ncbi:MAG: LmeA family phospholipid-binding protein [Actinomycetota bacterium]
MRKFLVFFVVTLLVLAVVGDFVVKAAAERAVATELSSTLELAENPEVGIESFPFLVGFFQGRLDTMIIESSDVEAGALTLDEVTLTLDDLEFEPGDVIGGDVDRITIGGGTGEGILTQSDLNRALRNEGVPVTATLARGAVSLETEAGSAEGDLALDDGVLVVSGPGGISVDFQLPSLGGRVTFDDLAIEGGRARLTLGVAPGELRPPG